MINKLRAHGLSVTPQRLAVLSVLEARRDHPTAEQIYQEVQGQQPAISFNTVYKTLEILCRTGLIIKVNPLHEVARYDARTHSHAHLVCRECHYIYDLEMELPTLSLDEAQVPAGFKVESESVIFWGTCPRCQKTQMN